VERRAAAPLAILVLLLSAAAPVWAEIRQADDILASFDARLKPSKLPRHEPAPVGIRVGGDFRADGGELPQLRQIRVGINRGGRLFDRGLPVCRIHRIQPGSERRAREICGGAIVGRGRLAVEVRVPGQRPFEVNARLLAFNGPRHKGRKLLYAQAYARNPPGSFVLTFRVSRRAGVYGTVLATRLPPATREWAYLTLFEMTLRRTYSLRGKRRSYLSAACRAPEGFSRVVFPLARATYVFADGPRISIPVARSCRTTD
jgi:hypothetical protein